MEIDNLTNMMVYKEKKRKCSNPPTELQEQIVFVEWLKLRKIEFFAIPNGGKRGVIEAALLKRSGVVPGVPDIFIPRPTARYAGLFVEMKRKSGGIISSEQHAWIDLLNKLGYFAIVCRGADEAIDIVKWYFGEMDASK